MEALAELTDTFSGEVVLPGDPEYDSARVVWNGMIDRRPALVVRPTGSDDVVSALRFAREQDLIVAVRGGGHSISGQSTCDDGIVIDLSRMGGVRVDPEQRRAVAGGGALLSELDTEAQAHGLVCPVGVVSHTGVAGLTLGGGVGRLQRKYGLTIDNLLAVDLVSADGRVTRASEDENADLFWGLRGAGANFGIVTSFEFRLHPLDPTVTAGAVLHPIERARELADLFRQIADIGSNDWFAAFALGVAPAAYDFPPDLAGKPIAAISVMHSGSLATAERDLAELRAFGPPIVDSIAPKTYLSVQQMNDEAMGWGHRFYMKSAFLPTLPDELVDLLVERVSNGPGGAEAGISMWPFGRAIADVPDEATAFTGREAAFWLGAEVFWDDPALDDRARQWGRAALADVEPFAITGRYVNDVMESGEARSVYGDAKYERLVALKRAWDPENVFRLNQNLQP
ncbi:MAG TPA: FAD-binding oxidoreductase [Gaiellaceae bacterium]|nr:FAD-binding oxidoreductase [Gaiellaceae bacterium]